MARLFPKKPKIPFSEVLASQGKQLTPEGKKFFSTGDKGGLRTLFAQMVLTGAFGELSTQQGKEQVARLIGPLGGPPAPPAPTRQDVDAGAQKAGEATRRRSVKRRGRRSTILTETTPLGGRETILG
ncbi:MAG: hypothetical protein ACUZ9M_00620 [Candidatus Scalindua sp.]